MENKPNKKQHTHYYTIDNAEIPSISIMRRESCGDMIVKDNSIIIKGSCLKECLETLNIIEPDLIKGKK